MDSHRRALLYRAVAGAMVAMLGTAALAGVAAADAGPAGPAGPVSASDHPGHDEECREYAQVPNPFVKVVAEDNKFDADCLQAPPNRKFRIYLENKDGDPHNISIYSKDPGDGKAEQLYKGKAIKGPGQEEYAVDELPPGEYYFQDDKVPDMNGKIQIEKPKK